MEPVQWPVRAGETPGVSRFFGRGQFFTPDRRGRFIPILAPETGAVDPAYPLTLNTGRIRDLWHTMTRTGKSVRLSAHLPEPTVALHPEDAREAGIVAGELAICEGSFGRMVGRAQIGSDQTRGTVFVPMHWTSQFASAGRVNALIPSAPIRYRASPRPRWRQRGSDPLRRSGTASP